MIMPDGYKPKKQKEKKIVFTEIELIRSIVYTLSAVMENTELKDRYFVIDTTLKEVHQYEKTFLFQDKLISKTSFEHMIEDFKNRTY